VSLELLFELILAILLGGLVGLEREFRGKPTGVRTTILICLGAVLFTRLSQSAALGSGDPGRLAAQIITGVGFLGGGAILRTRGKVTGLTSAATMWAVTAVGMTIGVGAHADAVGVTSLLLLVLVGSDALRRRLATARRGRRGQGARSRALMSMRPESGPAPEGG
jgi:putative Mg2+ transporter-C (MgtC) family protein